MRSFLFALELRPIPGPEAPPVETPWLGYLALAATAVVALLAVGVAAGFWRRRRTGVPLSPRDWALAELNRIEKLPARDEEARRKQMAALANMLRRYLSLRFQLPAPEQTTEEFRQALQAHPALAEEQRAWILGFLADADLVKFARGIVAQEEVQGRLDQLRGLISSPSYEGGAGGVARPATDAAIPPTPPSQGGEKNNSLA